MSRRFHGFLLATLGLLLAAQAAVGQSAGQQIIAALERYRLAVLQSDIESEVASFTEDGELSEGNDPVMQGRITIRSLLSAQRKTKVVAYELQTASTRVEVSSAVQNGFYRQRTISPEQPSIEVHGTFEIRWARQADGSWLISRLHTQAVQRASR